MKYIFSLFFLVCAVGCQTGPSVETFEEIPMESTKGGVLHALGNPKQTYRKEGTDRWVYRWTEMDQLLEKEIWFQNGRVVYKDGVRNNRKQPTGPRDSDFVPIE